MVGTTVTARKPDTTLKRDAYLKQHGYRVLRFWNNDVRENIDGVLSVIYDALTNTPTPPTLILPHRKRGRGN